MKTLWISLMLLSLVGCLKTREQLSQGGSGNMRTDASGSYVSGEMGQQQRAQIDSRFFEIDRDFRELYGKIETVERSVDEIKLKSANAPATDVTGAPSAKVTALEKRVATLEEALLAIDKKLGQVSGAKTSSTSLPKAKGPFGRGEQLFRQGKYAEAIASFDTYRKRYPKGRRYAQATLMMGKSFQRLKLNQDAKAFYKEVIQRYPNTKVSLQAQQNIKSL